MLLAFLNSRSNAAARLAGKIKSLVDLGQFEEADRLADKGLRRYPEHAAILEQYAFGAHNSGRHADARDRWDRLRACQPRSVMAWAGGACNRRELGDSAGAAELILEALDRYPRNALLLSEAHRIFLKLKPGEARAKLKAILTGCGDPDETQQYARAFTLPPGSSASIDPIPISAGSRASDIVKALSLLTPYETGKQKVRIGPPGDGGYILLDLLNAGQAVLSYGIGFQYDFDREMASRGHDVYMFDHTIPPLDLTPGHMSFFSEGLAGHSEPDSRLYTVADHLDRHGIAGDRLILKMDAEGAEYEAFDTMAESVLARFEQMSIEFHFLEMLDKPTFREVFIRVFEKINAHFTLFHVHANNGGGPDTFAFVGGLPIPNLLELSYVRTSLIERRANATAYPTELDFPCHQARDQRLWIYPFLPTGIDQETLRASWEFTELLAGGFKAV